MSGTRGKWRQWLPIGAMIVAVVAFSWLAVWQYHRAHERERLIAAVEAARTASPVRLGGGNLAELPRHAHVYVHGRYDGKHQVLLMEMTQPRGQGVGAEVLTPLILTSGARLLVNRGWVPADARGAIRADLAPPSGTVRATGFLAHLPSPGLHLGGNPPRAKEWPARLLFPNWAELDRLYGKGLMHRMLLLAADVPGGYSRNWNMRPAHGPQQNYSYMVQWIIFAVVVFGIWLGFTIRRLRHRRRQA